MRGEPTSAEESRGRGRPPMTERRREIVRLQIATAALELFGAQGFAATTGEQIADRLGISVRTLWRYCSSKEGCVQPLLAHGTSVVVDRLRAWPRDTPLLDRLLHEDDLTAGIPQATLDLARLTRTEPALRSVWLQSQTDAERAFAEAVAERTGRPAEALETKLRAGMLAAALRIAVEHQAWGTGGSGHPDPSAPDGGGLTAATRAALRAAISGLEP